ncbi:MAG: hypothetical protein ACLFOY_14580 [Desulfatibacillaceae bacterium]
MKYIVFFILVTLLPVQAAWADDFVLIANDGVPVESISRQELQSIFLGKKKLWKGGRTVEPVLLESGQVHEAFLRRLVRKTPSQFSTYWKRMIFTGRSAAPRYVRSEKDMISYVAGTEGAVGYVQNAPDNPAVKTLRLE